MIKEYRLPEGQDFMIPAESVHKIMTEAAHVEEVIFVICTKGSAIVEIDMQTYELHEHNEMILMPGSLVRCLSISPDFESREFVASQKFFFNVGFKADPDFYKYLKFTPVVKISEEAYESVVSHVYALVYDICSKPDSKYAVPKMRNIIQYYLMQINEVTYTRWRDESGENNSGRQTDVFRRFMTLVHDNATLRHDVDWYANQLAITPRYLCQICQNKNVTPKAIIDEQIIHLAKEMLHSTELSVQQITANLNFADQSVFARFFKRKTGESPILWRKKAR